MQSKIVEANQTLSKAKKVVKKSDILAQTRIVLSEGRILHQQNKFPEALPHFEKAYKNFSCK